MWEINLKNKGQPTLLNTKVYDKALCFSLCRVGVVESEEATEAQETDQDVCRNSIHIQRRCYKQGER